MDKKYIDANPLIERFKKLETTSLFNKTIYAFIVTMLAEQPVANVQEVRHARWIVGDWMSKKGKSRFKCDCCGAICKKSNYCPCCGARMDGEENA